jgi:hypothetical protein
MHGAGGGAPQGKRNGNYRHGGRTKEAIAARATIQEMARLCRQTLDAIEDAEIGGAQNSVTFKEQA